MKAALLAAVVVLGAALLVVPALGLGSGDGRKVLEARVLAPLAPPYLGPAGTIRNVPGAGAQWSIGDAEVDLRSDGRLEIDVEGLIVTPLGRNPLPQFKAIVSCQTTINGTAAVANVSSPLVAASPTGDAEIDTTIALPSPCIAPIVFVTSPGGAWFAATGR